MGVCARPECGKDIGMIPFRIINRPENYCSRECVDLILAEGHRAKKGRSSMKVPAKDFGDAGVVRQVCDNPECRKPLGALPDGTTTPAWKGRNGSYCSNDCLVRSEEMENENVAASSPITAGSNPAKKAPAKKAAAKTTSAPKKAPTPAPKKAPTPAPKKAPEKKAAPAPKKGTSDEVFRAGSTKAAIFNLLKDGKVHERSQVYDLIAKANKSNQLLHWVLTALPTKGFKVLQDGKEIQIAKK